MSFSVKPFPSPPVMRSRTPDAVPSLQSGDHLSLAEFRHRYEAQPHIKKAELIEGVVIVSSPVLHQQHGRPHAMLVGWLMFYLAATPYLDLSDNATLHLDKKNEVQPDALLRLPTHLGGQSSVMENGYLQGAPELVVEVAYSSASHDLYEKRKLYTRVGVKEYLVAQTHEGAFSWFILDKGKYQLLEPDAQGVLRSQVFPGLWLNPAAFWSNDIPALFATLQAGVNTPDHAVFVNQLTNQ